MSGLDSANSMAANHYLANDRLNGFARIASQIAELDQRVDEAMHGGSAWQDVAACLNDDVVVPAQEFDKPPAVEIWGVPFSRLTLAETLHHMDRLVARGNPGYFITANINYCMLTSMDPQLRSINSGAAFIVCDGMPILWRSRLTDRPLPERVAGSDLIYAMAKWASIKGYRVYFLGGAAGVAQRAADALVMRYPDLQIAGVHSPPFRPLSDLEQTELVRSVRDAKPDMLLVALGQPKGEQWIAEHCEALGVPLCVQIGASFDFVAGNIARAPKWMQRVGLEWAYRILREPRRLAKRYWNNARFLLRSIGREVFC